MTAQQLLAKPATSLLDLPDEIVLLVFEQVCQQSDSAIPAPAPLQSSGFSINKRIFEITRPLWSKRLSIQESQLDVRLAGIHIHQKRRDLLRMLDVPVTNHLYNFLNSVFPRLPLLTHLTLQIPENATVLATTTIAEGLTKLVKLEKLRLQSPRQLTLYDFFHRYLAHNPFKIPHVSFEINGVPRITQGLEEGFRCDSFRWTADLPSSFFRFDWSSLRSLELRGWSGYLPWADSVLEGLRTAITGTGVSFPSLSTIAL